MKKLLTTGTLIATTATLISVISCSKDIDKTSINTTKGPTTNSLTEQKSNKHILQFLLEPTNLQLVSGDQVQKAMDVDPKYPFNVVGQNGLMSKSNDIFNIEGATYREALEKISGVSIVNSEITAMLGTELITKRVYKVITGTAAPISLSDKTGIITELNKIFDSTFTSSHWDKNASDPYGMMGFGKHLLTNATNVFKKTDTPEEMYDKLASNKDTLPTSVITKSSGYKTGMHINLYNGTQKVNLDNALPKERKIILTVKIEA